MLNPVFCREFMAIPHHILGDRKYITLQNIKKAALARAHKAVKDNNVSELDAALCETYKLYQHKEKTVKRVNIAWVDDGFDERRVCVGTKQVWDDNAYDQEAWDEARYQGWSQPGPDAKKGAWKTEEIFEIKCVPRPKRQKKTTRSEVEKSEECISTGFCISEKEKSVLLKKAIDTQKPDAAVTLLLAGTKANAFKLVRSHIKKYRFRDEDEKTLLRAKLDEVVKRDQYHAAQSNSKDRTAILPKQVEHVLAKLNTKYVEYGLRYKNTASHKQDEARQLINYTQQMLDNDGNFNIGFNTRLPRLVYTLGSELRNIRSEIKKIRDAEYRFALLERKRAHTTAVTLLKKSQSDFSPNKDAMRALYQAQLNTMLAELRVKEVQYAMRIEKGREYRGIVSQATHYSATEKQKTVRRMIEKVQAMQASLETMSALKEIALDGVDDAAKNGSLGKINDALGALYRRTTHFLNAQCSVQQRPVDYRLFPAAPKPTTPTGLSDSNDTPTSIVNPDITAQIG